MSLTRCQLFAMPERSRATVYRNRLATEKLRHARRCAKQFATFLMAEGDVDCSLHYRGRTHAIEIGGLSWSTLDAVVLGGYKLGVRNTLQHKYQVHPALLDYATRLVAAEMGANEDLTAPRLRSIAA